MDRLRGVILGLFGGDRRMLSRDVLDRQDLEYRHIQVALLVSKLNGHSPDDILAEAYCKADEALSR